MVNYHLQNNLQKIKAIIDLLKKTHAQQVKKGLNEFITAFYKFVPSEDLDRYDIPQLAAAVSNTFSYFQKRAKGTPAIRIFNPTIKEHGWECKYTVIELINDDMPFLVDSITEELTRQELKIYSLAHPVIVALRDKSHNITAVSAVKNGIETDTESVMQFQITRLSKDQAEQLEQDIINVLRSVIIAVQDWSKILEIVNGVIAELSTTAALISNTSTANEKKQITENTNEIVAFLEWMKNNNFVFLGCLEYEINNKSNEMQIVKNSKKGIFKLSNPELIPKRTKQSAENPLLGKHPKILDITKANRKSIVHRPVHMDYIGVKRLNEKGQIIGEHRFIGLFTSGVYFQSARNIPIIRKKLDAIRKRSGFAASSHSGKALAAVLEDFPRDELLQSTINQLFDAAMGITLLAVQPKVKLFLRLDEFERFFSCQIFIPRDSMSTELRVKMGDIISRSLKGTIVNHYTQITESHLARVQIIIKTKPGDIPQYDVAEIEEELAQAAQRWDDKLHDELLNRFGESKGGQVFENYKNAFSVSYQNRFTTEDVYYDILQIEKVITENIVCFDIYESMEGTSETFEFKIYTPDTQIFLSKIMPILENMGLSTLDEHTYLAKPYTGDKSVWVHRFRFMLTGAIKPKLKDIKHNFEEAVCKTWQADVQNDALNRLILLAKLQWRDVSLLRAYSKYLQQSGFSYSQAYIQEALSSHPKLVRLLIQLFYANFDPSNPKKQAELLFNESMQQIESILGKVSNLAEDRVIRGFKQLILATTRTNYFQKDENDSLKDYISFKFCSSKISWLPEPVPYAEIFVYSARVEGVHLRGGKVARGGLRWSDRREDFRTEVLGLMKAQMTKNSVIIPVGSKGGFVVKKSPAEGGREALLKEGKECYKTFLRGLLDLTDNIIDGKIKHPKQVVRHDDDDPYLVVAADKGTATFSDIANTVAAEYQFWLDDAFASGGSDGYDHKKMGITAKGAWISVQRHFSEIGVNVDKDQFTVVGIGDMAGDVFGNGMLCSKCIKLVAAFNHLHIFIDPTPDPAKSFKERKRLFKLPRSSWTDYDNKLISKGGGVFERSAKSIKLSPQIKELLNTKQDSMTPDELIKHILAAPVDLLWNGGIGTYVKSITETHDGVGDKANDMLRINGEDLQAKVVGEGGNLGFTQLGRIEYARHGGRINSDSIDNSAGVDCSDHEVNIKIVLSDAVANNKITLTERNKLLESMTNAVSDLVLRDNVLQTQALTIAELQENQILEILGRFISMLERNGHLNREMEFLPSEEEIAKRHAEGTGLTRPELSVILAYSKILLYEELLKSKLPDDSYYAADLVRYFPEAIRKGFRREIEKHPLRREIIATSVTNSILNRIGSAVFFLMQEETGMDLCDIARAYTISRQIFGLRALWEEIAASDKVDLQHKKELYTEIQEIVERSSTWFLRKYRQPLNISKVIERFAPGIKELSGCLANILPESLCASYSTRLNRYKSFGISESLAIRIAGLEALAAACDIIEIARRSKLQVKVVGKVYFDIGNRLNLGWICKVIANITAYSHWEKMSHKTLVDEVFEQQRALVTNVIKYLCNDSKCTNALDAWESDNLKQIERYDQFVNDIKSHDEPDISMLIIALRKIKEISVN